MNIALRNINVNVEYYFLVWCSLDVSLVNDGPAVRGSNITFTARVKGYGGENLKYVFSDDVQPQHEQEV